MPRLIVFNQVTLDGYFTGEQGDLSWAKARNKDPEWAAFVAENAGSGGVLLFGRVTYEMMVGYWPTPEAAKNDPVVAERMNSLSKVVFSKSLKKANWNNTRIVKGDLADEIRAMKQDRGADLVILGSGTLVAQLAQEGLIDEYRLVLIPVVLGKGRTMFEGVTKKPLMRPTGSRTFRNGYMVLTYVPVADEGAGKEEWEEAMVAEERPKAVTSRP
jgi:dihydrofolate reductase